MIPMSARLARMVETSLTIKVFAICFLSVHVPLLVFIAYLAGGRAAEPILLLAATAMVTDRRTSAHDARSNDCSAAAAGPDDGKHIL